MTTATGVVTSRGGDGWQREPGGSRGAGPRTGAGDARASDARVGDDDAGGGGSDCRGQPAGDADDGAHPAGAGGDVRGRRFAVPAGDQ
eukprot:6333551-Pyramimonas_sp.AAC.1